MKKIITGCIFSSLIAIAFPTSANDQLDYHEIVTDSSGNILPWYDPDPAVSYDHVIGLVWNFWNTIRMDFNGLPYYMNHQVWAADHDDPRGLGGDQFQMALSSWQLLYAYSGNPAVKDNMKFIADYYLSHSLSPENSLWPNLPYPYNTLIYSGVYDGDMIIGKGFLQPDKAGSLALELVHLYKMSTQDYSAPTTPDQYLNAALAIAKTLMQHLKTGDENTSPLPFKVNAETGEVGHLQSNSGDGTSVGLASYTSNWAPTMELLLELQTLDPSHKSDYNHAFKILLNWMTKYPLKNNKWGPFFEDVQGWSDTQINAVTFAHFMMQHREYFPNWKSDIPNIFSWVYSTLGNDQWEKFGVSIVNEQTSYPFPGQSHVSRQGATELEFCSLTGNCTNKAEAIRRLSWATYMVDVDGKNKFPFDGNWLTDGYGDYVRHYLRAMAALPELSPARLHILSSTSVVQEADYGGSDPIHPNSLYYRTFDASGTELIRLPTKPSTIQLGGQALTESKTKGQANAYVWTDLNSGGYIELTRGKGTEVFIQQ